MIKYLCPPVFPFNLEDGRADISKGVLLPVQFDSMK